MLINFKKGYSLVMKEINSETHSCTHSFASFAILALSGSARFIIRATFAIGRNRSCSLKSSTSSSPEGCAPSDMAKVDKRSNVLNVYITITVYRSIFNAGRFIRN